MAGELVFITGATGFIGFAVLHKALESGYRVRISIRKEPQIQTIYSHPLIAPFVAQGKVSFAIVPDITVPGAFDEALKDVVYVQHLASALPVPTDNPERDIVQPAIHGTTSILTSALLHTSIKRIIITSSIAALLSSAAQTDSAPTPAPYTSSSRVSPLPLPSGPWPNSVVAYRGAKALALDATDRFVAGEKPRFSVVNIMPGYVIGRNERAASSRELLGGSNGVVLALVTGSVREEAQLATVVDVRDVARVQVGALDEGRVVGAYRGFVVDAGKVDLNDVVGIARREFGGAFEKGILREGRTNSVSRDFDARETEEVFGELRGLEEMVKSVVGQYVELKEKEV